MVRPQEDLASMLKEDGMQNQHHAKADRNFPSLG